MLLMPTVGLASTGESDPYFSSVVLLAHMEGTNGSTTFTDSSSLNRLIQVGGNAQISTSDSKYGTGSALFDGSGDYLELANSTDWDMMTANFTLELWVKLAVTGTDMEFMTHFQDASNFWMIQNRGGTNQLKFHNTADGGDIAVTTAINDSTTWHHVAVVKSGSTVTIYKDGVAGGTTGAVTTNFDGALYLGSRGPVTNPLNGRLDDVRITKGVARYTGNFTPPSSQFPDN